MRAISGTKCSFNPPAQGPIGPDTWRLGRTSCGVSQVCMLVVGLMEGVKRDIIGRDKGSENAIVIINLPRAASGSGATGKKEWPVILCDPMLFM